MTLNYSSTFSEKYDGSSIKSVILWRVTASKQFRALPDTRDTRFIMWACENETYLWVLVLSSCGLWMQPLTVELQANYPSHRSHHFLKQKVEKKKNEWLQQDRERMWKSKHVERSLFNPCLVFMSGRGFFCAHQRETILFIIFSDSGSSNLDSSAFALFLWSTYKRIHFQRTHNVHPIHIYVMFRMFWSTEFGEK